MKRRDFLKSAATASAAAVLGSFEANLSAVQRESTPGKIERRSLGKTGLKLSMLGFGGLVLKDSTPQRARELVSKAFDRGVNYFDVAPSYGDSEEKLGPALEPIRKRVFLACKTTKRTRKEATEELESSLKRLRTDHFDIYQLHAVTTTQDVETIFSPDGAIHAFEEARKAGKIRLIGFSAHSVEAALALIDRFEFDTIMFPVNYATWHAGNFGPQVLLRAQEKKMGILALKAMAKRPWPKDADRSAYPNCWYEPFSDPAEALKAIRFTLSHPVTAILQPADPKCLEMALDLVPRFEPLTPAEVEEVKRKGFEQAPLFTYTRPRRSPESKG